MPGTIFYVDLVRPTDPCMPAIECIWFAYEPSYGSIVRRNDLAIRATTTALARRFRLRRSFIAVNARSDFNIDAYDKNALGRPAVTYAQIGKYPGCFCAIKRWGSMVRRLVIIEPSANDARKEDKNTGCQAYACNRIGLQPQGERTCAHSHRATEP